MNFYSDRTWMARRKSSTEIGATSEFRAGCQVFLEYAYNHPECVNDKNQIRCPCWKCKNNNYMDRDMVNYHLLVNGFMRNYEECWWAHGQKRDVGYTSKISSNSNTHRMDEMVHDIAGSNFDWEEAREQPMNFDAKAFLKLLEEGRKPCWFDCHRRFLPVDHPFRRNREHFRKGKVENDKPVPQFSGTEMLACVMRLPVVPFEGSICEAYSFNEISMFVSDYFPDEVLTKANRVPRNDDGGNVELNGRLSVFGLAGRAYGKGKRIFLSEKDLHAAHNYILLNCEEIDEFVRLYDDELKVKHPGISDKDIQINRAKEFARWIKDKALAEGSTIPANVQTLALGPDMDQVSRNGYKVNGYEFHTKAYGHGKRTTNSGVCVLGDCYNELSHAFYGELEEIIELSYKGTYGGYINLFKCRWFDSEKGIRVDKHGIVDIDVHRSAYSNDPFVLPTQTKQVYFTPSPGRKRDRPPSDWQAVIHTPARRREEVVNGEFYQEEMLQRPAVINVDDNEVIELDGGDEPQEIDPESILVLDDIDIEGEEELLIDTDSESESQGDDGYESIEDDSDSETDT
ncbi:hypothetical protein POM88_021756 [Heracleum sosnowskyi]|uniref:Transposase n=1 Tax=Heracleum sosnowskyi TaxID=360622 RepID=A0AAD8LW70_9APIA|nr:hypothetical protein POM88_055094 [Heracleum sosnowskyi]KAK1350654.1 hypothetical protein POM88_054621 [Heracleum sosnowskyi]KAK1363886.1 hypothetical protein POM88_039447 [Heracleum sosnowskyi]KAK1384021.1 hypothetical protein POM88_021756 [Heracleum sosnowskyi]